MTIEERYIVAAKKIAASYEVTLADLMGQRGTAKVSEARQVLYYVAFFGFGLTGKQVGELAGKSQSTVNDGVHALQARMRASHALKLSVGLLVASIREETGEAEAA